MAVQSDKPRNINLNANDLERLLNGNRAIVRGLGGDPSGIKSKSTLSPVDALSKQRQMERDSFGLAPANQQQTPQMPQNTGSNSIQQILGQLQKLISGQGQEMPQFQPMQMPQFDPNRYKKQAEESVNAQFNPIIQQILGQQGQTQKRARNNRVSVRDLYAGAVNDINTQSAVGQKNYDAAQGQSKQLYEDERNRIAAGYAADAAAQREEAKRLGTEALGVNETIGQQNSDKQFADQMQSQQMQSSQGAFEQQQQAAGQYDRSIATATRAEGIESQEDIMNQLEEFMGQSNSDLANTRAQQAGSISDLMQKLAGAGYERDSQNQQFQYQQQRDYIGDSQNMMKMQQEQLMAQLEAQAAGQSRGEEKLNPWQQVATFAEQLQPGQGSSLVAAIQKAMTERGEIYARGKDDTEMNPALFAKLIADYPENSNLDRNSLMALSQELYRLLYGMG